MPRAGPAGLGDHHEAELPLEQHMAAECAAMPIEDKLGRRSLTWTGVPSGRQYSHCTPPLLCASCQIVQRRSIATTRITPRLRGEVQLVTGMPTHVTPSRRYGRVAARAPLHKLHATYLSAIRKTSGGITSGRSYVLLCFRRRSREALQAKRSTAQGCEVLPPPLELQWGA